jgi:methionyl-tRNA synthetase
VTTPLYYVNDAPHIGSAYTTIAADIIARWNRILGNKVFFLTGTDEHGAKIAEAAKEHNLEPKKFCDKIVPKFVDAWKLLNISYDFFIRTTDERHEKFVEKFMKKIKKKGDVYKGKYEGWYCVGCERFYPENELVNGKCPLHPNKDPIWSTEENYFFKLSKYQKILLDSIENLKDKNHYEILPLERKNEIVNRIKAGLQDVSLSRSGVAWGIPLPWDKKHTVYVWFDALLNYLSALDINKKKKFWPADYHLLAKDILWFHAVIWPAMLISAGEELPKKVFAHGYLTVNGQKMSKSLGNIIDPISFSIKYGLDSLRYFLFREVVFGYDGDFSEKEFVKRVNGDLADGLGNLLNRTLVLIEKTSGSEIEKAKPEPKILNKINEVIEFYKKEMDLLRFNVVLEKVWTLVFELNKYITDEKPWEIKNGKKLYQVLYTVAEGLRVIGILIYPFMPETAEKIFAQLGLDKKDILAKNLKFGVIKAGTKTKRSEVLFKKLEFEEKEPTFGPKPQQQASKKEVNKITIADFQKVELKVGTIKKVEKIEGADKLLKLIVDIGEERQLVAGIAKYYKPEELLGKQVIVVANLEPATLKGVQSDGMLLAAEVNGEPILLTTDKKTKNGAKIR